MKAINYGFTLDVSHFDYLQQERCDNDLPPIPDEVIERAMDKAAEKVRCDDVFNKALNRLQDIIEDYIDRDQHCMIGTEGQDRESYSDDQDRDHYEPSQ